MKSRVFSFFWSIILPYKWYYLIMFQVPLIGVAYHIANSYSLKLIIDVFSQNSAPKPTDLLFPVSLFIGIVVAQEIICRAAQWAFLKSQPFVRSEILIRSYEYVQNHSYNFFQNTYSGTVSSKIKGVVAGYDNLWEDIWYKVANPLALVVAGVVSLFFINWDLFLFVAIWCVIFFYIMLKMSSKLSKLSMDSHEMKHKAIGLISDNITNIFTIFSFASKSRELKKIRKFAKDHVSSRDYAMQCYGQKLACTGSILYTIMLSFVMIYTIYLRYISKITTGDFAFVISVISFVVTNIWTLVEKVGNFFDHLGDFRSSFSILQIPHDRIDTEDAVRLKVTKGEIIFKNISFHYENNVKVFEDLNLHIKPGEKVGIVGHSGAGKSTLISLLFKNFKAVEGNVIIDNQSIYDVTSDSLRLQVSLIPQDIMLFHRSIGDNIGYAKERATQQEIVSAAKAANIHEFIKGLPEGYDTMVGERGVKLSGGQRQRIAIARAILKNAPILILDEATSSLDSHTEKEIQKSINTMLEKNNATVIAVAHRLSTIKHMDRIIVMDDGQVIEDGSFAELVGKKDGKFKELWDRQIDGMV